MDIMQSMAVFRRVVEAGSFSAVARETSMSQSSVSKHVAALEERLGTKLLNRSTRRLNPTEAGTEYYHHCVRILNDFQEAEASVGKGKILPTGTLRMVSTSPFSRHFIIPLLPAFLKKYPDIQIDFLLEDRPLDLVKAGVDLAIRVGPLSDSALIARRIGSCERMLVASAGYLMAHGFPKTPSDLANHQCLLYSHRKKPEEWFFNSLRNGEESVHVRSRLRASSNDAVLDAAVAGLGIASVCDWHAREHVRRGRLTVLLKEYRQTPYDIHAVYPERKFVPQKVKRMIEHLKTRLKETKREN